jgi:hypothetical protein
MNFGTLGGNPFLQALSLRSPAAIFDALRIGAVTTCFKCAYFQKIQSCSPVRVSAISRVALRQYV